MADDATRARSATTREALLAAAERLFLSEGYDKVSVRSICAAADANIAAVHYHFGSKDDLTVALLEDRLAPLWADPLAAIDPDRDSVAHVASVIVGPLLTMQRDPIGHLHLRLLARFVFTHPDARFTERWFRLDSWADILTALLPGLTRDAARRRWALAFTLILSRVSAPDPIGRSGADALTDFVVAGLTAAPARS